MSEIKLDFQSNKLYSTKGTLSIFDSNDVLLHSDTLDLASDKKRKAFVKDVVGMFEAISAEKLQRAILEQIARIQTEKRRADENIADNEDEAQPLAKSRSVLAGTDLELVRLKPKAKADEAANEPQAGLAGGNRNMVSWDDENADYYSKKRAIDDAKKAGQECSVAELASLDYNKLNSLLRKPGCTIKYMSRTSPPRGKVHKKDWQKHLKTVIDHEEEFPDAVEHEVANRLQFFASRLSIVGRETLYAKNNVVALFILILFAAALGTSLLAARHILRNTLMRTSLRAGEAAFENKDWLAAYRNFREYLDRNPDDVEIIKKCAQARLCIRPLDTTAISKAIAAYRRVTQLSPLDEIAYDRLAMLYIGTGKFNELAYIARKRLKHVPKDREAPLWLADALVQLGKTDEAEQTLLKLIKDLEVFPDKHVEYVRACVQMAMIADIDDSTGAKTQALEWLNRAVDYAPKSVEALAHRARFYRQTPNISGMSEKDMLAAARKDLEATEDMSTEGSRIHLFLGAEWMANGELHRAAAELRAAESLVQESLEEYSFDTNNWTIARFHLASELARRRAAPTEGASLADEALTVLKERRYRVQILAPAIELYVAAGKLLEARRCLDEYHETMYTYTREGAAATKLRLAYLQALLAKGEGRLYAVIDVLQPAVMSNASRPELWQLLAEAYSRTDQTRRAISALTKYLRFHPRDPEMTLQLAKEYLKLRDWNRAFEAARLAEPLDPTGIVIRLLRIEASIYSVVCQAYRMDINKARIEELSTELGELRKKHPDRVDIRMLQAIIAVYFEQPDRAERELTLAIAECEEPLMAEMQLVRHYYRTKRMTEAFNVCQIACERHSEVAEPWLSLSGLHVANADYESARSCLRQGLNAAIGQWEKRSVSLRLALVELLYGDRATGTSILTDLAAQYEQEIRARSLLLGIREVQEDQATAERLVGELREAEGETGFFWRLHQASLWLASDDWRSKQPDITELLQSCINADPEWSSPVLLLVEMYEKLEDFGRVEDTCRRMLVRNPSATDIAARLVTLLENQGRFSDAEKVIRQIETTPRVASEWALRAGDFSGAMDELMLRASNDDRDASSRILLVRLLYWETRDAEQALAYLKEAEAITPDSMAINAAKVSILRAEGQAEEAKLILDDYVANSDVFNAYLMRAGYLANEGEFKRAEKDYMRLTTFTENGSRGYELLSDFYARNEKFDEAVVTLEDGLKAYPADLRLKRRLMKTLFLRANAQDRQVALEILATLEERSPHDPELMKLRALQMLEDSTPQSLQTARAKLKNVVKLEPTAVDAHLVLIGIAMQEGENETARNLAIRAVGSNPNNSELLLARGRVELALENALMAAELARLVFQKDPNNTEARDLLVEAALSSKDSSLLEEARALIESAAGGDPADE